MPSPSCCQPMGDADTWRGRGRGVPAPGCLSLVYFVFKGRYALEPGVFCSLPKHPKGRLWLLFLVSSQPPSCTSQKSTRTPRRPAPDPAPSFTEITSLGLCLLSGKMGFSCVAHFTGAASVSEESTHKVRHPQNCHRARKRAACHSTYL